MIALGEQLDFSARLRDCAKDRGTLMLQPAIQRDSRFRFALQCRYGYFADRVAYEILSVGSRTGAPAGRLTVPRFQSPPLRTQRADFPHCAPPFASRQSLWDLSCWGDFRPVAR